MEKINLNDYPDVVTLGYFFNNGYSQQLFDNVISVNKTVIDEEYTYTYDQIIIKKEFYDEVVSKFADVGINVTEDNYHSIFLKTNSYTQLKSDRTRLLRQKEQNRENNINTCINCIKQLDEDGLKYIKNYINQLEK